MSTINMYRPVVRVSATVEGYVAGVCDPQAKLEGNIRARIKLAIDDMAEAMKEKNSSAFAGAVRRKSLLQKMLKGAMLSHDDLLFCGMVVAEVPEVRDTRTLEQLTAERVR